ncbi:nuclear cap-binding protein subunit 3-like isoform X2 [Acanthaster planci]|uniref:Nuclear cap-binding protein subunit 3 n=1 Tax=Acanthaster planci TaxID=133434 RepID=A0A8B7Y071_ACAPL|nr:nuclear cap-binding protein subunit 3-like isoform X2 [Acanthaster planci]
MSRGETGLRKWRPPVSKLALISDINKMAEKGDGRSQPVLPRNSDEKDDPLDLLQSESSESESESRKKQSDEKITNKREFKGDGIDKSLSELATNSEGCWGPRTRPRKLGLSQRGSVACVPTSWRDVCVLPSGPWHSLGLTELKKENVKRYPNKNSGNFVTGFDVHSKEAKIKRRERARRFGIKSPDKTSKTEKLSSVILPPGSTIGGHRVRAEAIFILGVDEMSTQDVFNYFKDYDPSSIEWINDTSCNVVWLDPHSAARALFNMSQPQHILPQQVHVLPPQPSPPPVREEQEPEPMEQEEEDDDDDFLDLVSDRETGEQERHRRSTSRSPNPTPSAAPSAHSPPTSSTLGRSMDDNSTMEDDMDMGPVHLSHEEATRTGLPCPEAEKELVMRYATTADKKVFDPSHRSQYYIKYGNPNFGGMKGLISGSLKKKIREGKFVPGQRKRRYGDDDASDDEDRQEYARKRRNHGNGDDSQSHRRMEERDSDDGDSVEMDLRLLTKPVQPRRPMRMYADDLEDQIKAVRNKPAVATPQMTDARERLRMNHPVATSRQGLLAYQASDDNSGNSGNESDTGGGFLTGSIPNLKIMLSNDGNAWDDDDDDEEDDDDEGDDAGAGNEVAPPRGLPDLRSRLKNRHSHPHILDTLPSLSVQVDRDDI